MNWPNVGKLRSENNYILAKIMPIWVKYDQNLLLSYPYPSEVIH